MLHDLVLLLSSSYVVTFKKGVEQFISAKIQKILK